MSNIPGGRFGFTMVSIVVFAVLGSGLEGVPAIVLAGPLMFPIAVNLGIHPVQYAMVAVLSMSLGLFSPPFGVGFYGACIVGGISPDKALRDIWIYWPRCCSPSCLLRLSRGYRADFCKTGARKRLGFQLASEDPHRLVPR